MSSSDRHQCKLCGHETHVIFAYPHEIPEIILFKAYEKRSDIEGKWIDIDLRICPKCGHIQGEILTDEME